MTIPERAFYKNGKLHDSNGYLYWDPGMELAVIDGLYSAADLRAIADWMDKHSKETSNVPT